MFGECEWGIACQSHTFSDLTTIFKSSGRKKRVRNFFCSLTGPVQFSRLAVMEKKYLDII